MSSLRPVVVVVVVLGGGVLPPSGAGFCEADCRRKRHSSIHVKHTSLSIITIQSRFPPQNTLYLINVIMGVQPHIQRSPEERTPCSVNHIRELNVEHPVRQVVYFVAFIPPALSMVHRGQPLIPRKFKPPDSELQCVCAVWTLSASPAIGDAGWRVSGLAYQNKIPKCYNATNGLL